MKGKLSGVDWGKAMYPNLPQREMPDKRENGGGKPGWAKSNDPMWGEIPPIPNMYDRIPTLRKVNR